MCSIGSIYMASSSVCGFRHLPCSCITITRTVCADWHFLGSVDAAGIYEGMLKALFAENKFLLTNNDVRQNRDIPPG